MDSSVADATRDVQSNAGSEMGVVRAHGIGEQLCTRHDNADLLVVTLFPAHPVCGHRSYAVCFMRYIIAFDKWRRNAQLPGGGNWIF